MEFLKIVGESIRNLLGKKTTQEILKFLATITMKYIAERFELNIYKYDKLDMKNMIYHNNLNNANQINPNQLDEMMSILTIDRFATEYNQQTTDTVDNWSMFEKISELCKDNSVINLYEDMNNNRMIQFDHDTLETSSIADNYEITSGGIYVPDRTIITLTPEGTNLADAKNEYLEKRMELGSNVSYEKLSKLVQEYCDKINSKDVDEYFKNIRG